MRTVFHFVEVEALPSAGDGGGDAVRDGLRAAGFGFPEDGGGGKACGLSGPRQLLRAGGMMAPLAVFLPFAPGGLDGRGSGGVDLARTGVLEIFVWRLPHPPWRREALRFISCCTSCSFLFGCTWCTTPMHVVHGWWCR